MLKNVLAWDFRFRKNQERIDLTKFSGQDCHVLAAEIFCRPKVLSTEFLSDTVRYFIKHMDGLIGKHFTSLIHKKNIDTFFQH